MVAKIKQGRSLIGALNYNENKVKSGKAEFIQAENYAKDYQDLTFYDKLLRLTDLAGRNETTKVNALHISLNFANGEKLEPEILQQIARDYMAGIGFSDQPFLTYQHDDAGHPHIHIVTTNIQSSGERIGLHLLGRDKSEPTRKALEIKYGLTKAQEQNTPVEKHQVKAAEYGKMESKRAITNIVNEVLRTYKFTSIPEMNAVLNQFNIAADRGSKDSRMFAKNGLVYWILDNQGNKLGVPIKASSIYGSPTISTLEKRFRLNEPLRKPLKDNLRRTIDKVMQNPISKQSLQAGLHQKGVQAIFRQNEEGRIFGITFVDHNAKVVFNGNDLGKEYSAAAIVNKLVNDTSKTSLSNDAKIDKPFNPLRNYNITMDTDSNNGRSLLDRLFEQEHQDLGAISKLQQNKRRKKRRGLNL